VKLYHGFLKSEAIPTKVNKITGNVPETTLVSTSSYVPEKFSWGNYGFILEVPDENVVGHFPSDSGTPTNVPRTIHDLKKIFEFVLLNGGVYSPSRLKSSYDEVVIQASKKNKIVGVWWKEGSEAAARNLMSMLEKQGIDIKYKECHKNKVPMGKEYKSFSLSTLSSSGLLPYEDKRKIKLEDPQGRYSIIFRPTFWETEKYKIKNTRVVEFVSEDAPELYERLVEALGGEELNTEKLRETFSYEEHEGKLSEYGLGGVVRYDFLDGMEVGFYKDKEGKERGFNLKIRLDEGRIKIAPSTAGRDMPGYFEVTSAILAYLVQNSKNRTSQTIQ